MLQIFTTFGIIENDAALWYLKFIVFPPPPSVAMEFLSTLIHFQVNIKECLYLELYKRRLLFKLCWWFLFSFLEQWHCLIKVSRLNRCLCILGYFYCVKKKKKKNNAAKFNWIFMEWINSKLSFLNTKKKKKKKKPFFN